MNAPTNPPTSSRGRNMALIALAIGVLLGILIDRVIAINAGSSGAAIVAIVLGLMGLTLGVASFLRPNSSATPINPVTTVTPITVQPNLLDVATPTAAPTITPIRAPVVPLRWFSGSGPLALTPSSALMFAAGLCLAVGGQVMLDDATLIGVLLFVAATGCIFLAVNGSATTATTNIDPASTDSTQSGHTLSMEWQLRIGAIALLAGAGAFAFSSGNRYTSLGVALWVLSIVLWLVAFTQYKDWLSRGSQFFTRISTLRPTQWLMAGLLIVVLCIGVGFRLYNLRNNPRDMNSDHTEKLLDVKSVLDGTPYIFFENNTGREPWQFYWTVAISKLLAIPANFLALKIGTALIGCLMLPAIFLLGRELFGWRVGLIALLFAGVCSWGVLAQRFGLRHGLNPAMVAWTLFFLVYGLKRSSRNAMLASGVAMGIGLQGYTPFRFMPIVYGLIIIVWAIWQWRRGNRPAIAWIAKHLGLAAVTALLVLMPLFRYTVESPDKVFYRTASRLTALDKPIDGDPNTILIDNIKNAMLAFNYTRDEVWVANLVDRPALDPVLGGLLIVGVAMALGLSFKRREPWPALLLLGSFCMLMPSALNVAYPRENPSVLRIGGAMPMLMVLCALVPGLLWEWASSQGANRLTSVRANPLPLISGALSAALCASVLLLNYNRVFVDYPKLYCPRAQNASDIGGDMAQFVARGNDPKNAYIVGFPYWVDSRAVGDFVGNIQFPNTVGQFVSQPPVDSVELNGAPGWFALAQSDTEDLALLQAKYPQGVARLVYSPQCPQDKSFMVFETQP